MELFENICIFESTITAYLNDLNTTDVVEKPRMKSSELTNFGKKKYRYSTVMKLISNNLNMLTMLSSPFIYAVGLFVDRFYESIFSYYCKKNGQFRLTKALAVFYYYVLMCKITIYFL